MQVGMETLTSPLQLLEPDVVQERFASGKDDYRNQDKQEYPHDL